MHAARQKHGQNCLLRMLEAGCRLGCPNFLGSMCNCLSGIKIFLDTTDMFFRLVITMIYRGSALYICEQIVMNYMQKTFWVFLSLTIAFLTAERTGCSLSYLPLIHGHSAGPPTESSQEGITQGQKHGKSLNWTFWKHFILFMWAVVRWQPGVYPFFGTMHSKKCRKGLLKYVPVLFLPCERWWQSASRMSFSVADWTQSNL